MPLIGNRVAVLMGGLGVAAVALARAARARRQVPATVGAGGPDPRAEELRRKLAEARDLEGERDEFEAAETPVDKAEAADGVDERRRRIHEEGRAAADEMRGGGDGTS